MLITWVDFFIKNEHIIRIPRLILVTSLYAIIFTNIFKEFKNREETDLDFIFGAVSAYLILGLLGSFTAVIMNYYYPGSFNFANNNSDFQDYIYFNFVTLTTLGYGDALPTSEQGQIHAILTAIVGQLYLTITIAIIVGKYLMHSSSDKK
jgi:hypothetical protein